LIFNMDEMIVMPKVWGSEEWIVNNKKYCGKILNLNEGFRCSIHYHIEKHETFYILDGEVLMELGDDKGINEYRIMKSGDIQVIEPKQKHRFTGIKNSRIIEFSTEHKEEDSYRDSQSGAIDPSKALSDLQINGIKEKN